MEVKIKMVGIIKECESCGKEDSIDPITDLCSENHITPSLQFLKIFEDICKKENITWEYYTGYGVAFIKERRIKVPLPKSPQKMVTCLHEIAHIQMGDIKPSYFEEYLAVKKSLEMARELGIKISRKIVKKEKWYVAYSLQQAIHRGLKTIIPEVKNYIKKEYPETAEGKYRFL